MCSEGVKSKTQAEKDGQTVQFANLMDLCHLKSAELAKRLQKCKGRVVLQRDNVKDEEGDRAVFTVQGASVSQMAAAEFLDTISELPGMAGETSDAIAAYTEVQMTDAIIIIIIAQHSQQLSFNPTLHHPRQCGRIHVINKGRSLN